MTVFRMLGRLDIPETHKTVTYKYKRIAMAQSASKDENKSSIKRLEQKQGLSKTEDQGREQPKEKASQVVNYINLSGMQTINLAVLMDGWTRVFIAINLVRIQLIAIAIVSSQTSPWLGFTAILVTEAFVIFLIWSHKG